jgi:hypothetical protein
MIGEADYLIRRATVQLDCAREAASHDVAAIHLELSSRYLARAQTLIDAERRIDRRENVVSIRR